MGEVAALLSPDQIIIEFLEDIEPTAQILERLQQLKSLVIELPWTILSTLLNMIPPWWI